jgi:hypothetical protein
MSVSRRLRVPFRNHEIHIDRAYRVYLNNQLDEFVILTQIVERYVLGFVLKPDA